MLLMAGRRGTVFADIMETLFTLWLGFKVQRGGAN